MLEIPDLFRDLLVKEPDVAHSVRGGVSKFKAALKARARGVCTRKV